VADVLPFVRTHARAGGFEGMIQPFVKEQLATLQPSAAVFNGCVQQGAGNNKSLCVSPNAVRWVGTEAGGAPDPDWSTGYENGGDPNAGWFSLRHV
jgi:alpha-L-fucosidase